MKNNSKLTSIIFAIAFLGNVECTIQNSFYTSRTGSVALNISQVEANLFVMPDKTVFLRDNEKRVHEVLNILATDRTGVVPKAYYETKDTKNSIPPIYLKEQKTVNSSSSGAVLSDYYIGLLIKTSDNLKSEVVKDPSDQTQTDSSPAESVSYKLLFQKKDSNGVYSFDEVPLTPTQLASFSKFNNSIELME